MKLRLKRFKFGEKSTLGKLFVDDVFQCYTLEDKVREQPGVAVEKWKVPHETAIPAGTYSVVIDYSTRFKRDLPHLLNVAGFEGIRIHSGNTDADTEGCILVGGTPVNDDFIPQSRQTFDHLFDLMDDAYERGEKIEIEVV